MVTNLPTAILTFDTDFDFDLSNAQFIKEELEREVQERMNEKGRWKLFMIKCFTLWKDLGFGLNTWNLNGNKIAIL